MNYLGLYLIIALITVNSIDVCASLPHSDNGVVAPGREIQGEPFDCLASAQQLLNAPGNGCKPASQPGQGDTKDAKEFECSGKNPIKHASIILSRDPKGNKPQTCEMTMESVDKKSGLMTTYTRKLDKDGFCIEASTGFNHTKGDEKTKGTTRQQVYCGKQDRIVTIQDDRKKENEKGASECNQIHMLNGVKKEFDCKQAAELVADKKFQEYKKDPKAIAGAPPRPIRVGEVKPRDVGGNTGASN